ncbi:MAG: fluoride efflux transporter CrcB [Thermonemataceae bacterium]|nr:fluoride efflux transporter CrcB [Thermonemataceae bacterium]
MWQNFLWVFLGGGFGSVARYSFGLLFSYLGFQKFPFATLLVNLLGSFLIGLFFGYFKEPFGKERLWIVTGFLGGFTTFSAFSYESFILFEKSFFLGLLNVSLNFLGALFLVWIGYKIIS